MELGSEFNLSLPDLTVKKNNIFTFLSEYNNVIYFDSGRSALRHLSSYIKPGEEILLPEFICKSVTSCFREEDIRFYRLHNKFTIDIEDLKKKMSSNTRAIFLMHYFGKVQPIKILNELENIAVEYGCLIIEDTTHSIFSNSGTVGDYQICSIRKWLPIPKGGVLYAQDDKLGIFEPKRYKISTDNERIYGMVLKDMFLKSDFDCNETYRQIFSRCEEKLDKQEEIFFISDLARYIATCVGIDDLIEARRDNYHHLRSTLNEKEITYAVSLAETECPLVLPIWVKERDRFRSYLMDNRVYCAVHWPFDGIQEEQRPFAKKCAKHLISLPIDQRYGLKEINYLIDIICRYGDDLLF